MINWLHTNIPNPVLIDFGLAQIHWYGLLFVIAVILAMATAVKLAEYYKFGKDLLLDLFFWLIIFGLLGARLYHIGLEYQYYLAQPIDMFKIWNGGLAIHGGIISGILVIYYFAKKHKINFWQLASIIVPGLSLAQGIGRWGNYFNQELYGKITDLPWSIPIIHSNLTLTYHHPAFLYESIGSFVIFGLLVLDHGYWLTDRKDAQKNIWLVIGYLIMYSILRFSIELLRIDTTPVVFGWRWPQLISIVVILACLIYIVYYWFNKRKTRLSKNKDN